MPSSEGDMTHQHSKNPQPLSAIPKLLQPKHWLFLACKTSYRTIPAFL